MADASEESDAPDPPDSDTEGEKGEESVQTLRRQVEEKYDLKEGDEETALQLLQSISALEEEYDVQLLTDADKDKIEKLS